MVFGRGAFCTRGSRNIGGKVVVTHIGAQRSDGFEKDAAVADRTNANFLQVLLREARKDPLIYLILAECRLILFEAKPPQPTSDVHGGAPVNLALHDPPGETCCLG